MKKDCGGFFINNKVLQEKHNKSAAHLNQANSSLLNRSSHTNYLNLSRSKGQTPNEIAKNSNIISPSSSKQMDRSKEKKHLSNVTTHNNRHDTRPIATPKVSTNSRSYLSNNSVHYKSRSPDVNRNVVIEQHNRQINNLTRQYERIRDKSNDSNISHKRIDNSYLKNQTEKEAKSSTNKLQLSKNDYISPVNNLNSSILNSRHVNLQNSSSKTPKSNHIESCSQENIIYSKVITRPISVTSNSCNSSRKNNIPKAEAPRNQKMEVERSHSPSEIRGRQEANKLRMVKRSVTPDDISTPNNIPNCQSDSINSKYYQESGDSNKFKPINTHSTGTATYDELRHLTNNEIESIEEIHIVFVNMLQKSHKIIKKQEHLTDHYDLFSTVTKCEEKDL